MPFITVDAKGTKLEYLDSGEHHSSRLRSHSHCRTVVIVHGHSFGALSFKKCLADAHRHNLRLIVLNRRGFGASTPFREDEIGPINAKTAAAADFVKFMEARAKEIAVFLRRLNGSLGENHDSRHGITLMGWSLGNAFCLKVVEMLEEGSLGELGAEINVLLNGYIIYDAPFWAMSCPPPTSASASYAIQIKKSNPASLQPLAFNRFLSSYFTYPPLSSISDPSQLVLMQPGGNMNKRSTVDKLIFEGKYGPEELTAEEISGRDRKGRDFGFTPGATRDDETILRGITRGVFDKTAGNVLFNSRDDKYGKRKGRNTKNAEMDIVTLYCENSPWILVYSAWAVMQRKKRGEGYRGPLKRINGANHFAHWDMSEEFLTITAKLVDGFTTPKARL